MMQKQRVGLEEAMMASSVTSTSKPQPKAAEPVRESSRFQLSGRARLGLFLLLLAVVFCQALSHIFGRPEIGYMMFVSKEGIVESLGATACLLAAVLFAAAADDTRRGGNRKGTRRWWLLAGLSAASVVMFLEEFGWGTRALAWYVPSTGIRQDFSLGRYLAPKHAELDVVGFYWYAALTMYCAIVSTATGVLSSLRGRIERVRLPIPSSGLGFLWLLMAAFSGILVISPSIALIEAQQRGEVFETVYQFLFAAWAVEEYGRASALRAAPGGRWVSWLAGGVVVVSFGAIVQDTIARQIPFTRSQVIVASIPQDADPETKIARFRKALSIYPANDLAHYSIALVLDEQNRLEEAIGHLRVAVRLAPENSAYHHFLGRTYLNMWDAKLYPAAEYHLKQAARLDPDGPHVNDVLLELNYINTVREIARQMLLHPKSKEMQAEFERRGRQLRKQVKSGEVE